MAPPSAGTAETTTAVGAPMSMTEQRLFEPTATMTHPWCDITRALERERARLAQVDDPAELARAAQHAGRTLSETACFVSGVLEQAATVHAAAQAALRYDPTTAEIPY